MLMPIHSACSTAAKIEASCAMHTRISGGDRLTEANALTVMPRSRPDSSRVVKTVTEEANRPRTERKRSGSIKGTGNWERESMLNQAERRKYVAGIHDLA